MPATIALTYVGSLRSLGFTARQAHCLAVFFATRHLPRHERVALWSLLGDTP